MCDNCDLVYFTEVATQKNRGGMERHETQTAPGEVLVEDLLDTDMEEEDTESSYSEEEEEEVCIVNT
jgi:hypothetical protein